MRLLVGMKRHTCTDCQQQIPNGLAHIRSVAFRQVAYCRACWMIRVAVREALKQFAA